MTCVSLRSLKLRGAGGAVKLYTLEKTTNYVPLQYHLGCGQCTLDITQDAD